MTPIERIRQKRQMVEMSIEAERPALMIKGFPRNTNALAILLFAVLPLLYKAVLAPSLVNIVGYGLCATGLGLALLALAAGQKQRAIYDGSPVGWVPVVPFKMLGSALLALSAGGLCVFEGGSIFQGFATVVVMGVLGVVAFGLDPRRNKGLDTVDARHTHKLEGLAARVGAQMERVHKCTSRVPVAEVVTAIRAFDEAVNRLLSSVTDDPDRAGSVRKYLTVYLDGVAEATERFAGIYVNSGSPDAKVEYLQMLNKLTKAYIAKAIAYAEAGRPDLDVQMAVLDDYLQRERLAG